MYAQVVAFGDRLGLYVHPFPGPRQIYEDCSLEKKSTQSYRIESGSMS